MYDLLQYNRCIDNVLYDNSLGVLVDKNASKTLRGRYISSRYSTAGDDWPPYQPKHYTTLALIHHKEKYADKKVISFVKELANKGKLVSKEHKVESSSVENNDDHQTGGRARNMKNISELFASSSSATEHSSEVFLIEGAPGIGKTILSKEIAYQWANDNLLQYKRLLFLVFLRTVDSSKIQSVEQFVQHVLKSCEMAASIGKYLIENNGKELVLVLDGYDELSEADRKKSFIAEIIGRQVLSKCLLVITSRPTASLALRGIVDCRVEIVGFTEEDRLDYIKTALPDSLEKVAVLQDYLKSNPTINALCYIPLNMTILLCLCENGISNLPKTQTEMYKKFIEMTIIRFLEKTNENISDAAAFNLDNLPSQHYTVFKELSQFAFKALTCDKLVFNLTEIQEICPSLTAMQSNWNGLGLLHSFTHFDGGNKIVTYHFLHFSIQEYMAGYHISTLPEKKQLQLLKSTFWSADYYNTWIMYVGITGGETFPLKHFLSGNFLRIFTWVFKTSISNKFVNNKIKCLHIFQCLAEAPNNDLITSIGNLFQNQELNLSNQTLLPRDLNTLGFFLVRSINKHWIKLDLSGCNMGCAGLKILFEWFVGKDTHSVVTIDRVDLSYNQLYFSSLVGLLNLLKAWRTSEMIIADDIITFGSETACNIFEAVEHVFFQSSDVVILETLLIGSFLFAYKLNENKMLELFTKVQGIKTMYLISCKWGLSISETEHLLRNQKLMNVHILGDFVSSNFLQAVCSAMSQCGNNFSLVIDDPTLSDQDADEISRLLPNYIPDGMVLIVSNSKIQEVISTCLLSSELSNLEMLNLMRRIRTLCSSCVPAVTAWNQNLLWYGHKSEGIIETFVNILFSYKNANRFHLKIGLVEENTLIAYAMTSEEILKILSCNGRKFLSSLYLSSCFISSNHWNNIIIDYSNISSLCLHLINCQVKVFNMLVTHEVVMLKELFLHSTGNITSDDVEAILSTYHHTSVVVVTKDTLAVCNPTSKQLAMAQHLEPSVTVWNFFRCKLHADTYKQIVILLMYNNKLLNELKFVGCDFGNTDIEMLCNQLIAVSPTLIIEKLHISSSRLISSVNIAKALQSVSSLSKLCINQNYDTEEAVNLIATVILSIRKLQILDIGGNNFQATGVMKIAKVLQNTSSLSEFHINNNNVTEEAADDIAAVVLSNSKLQILNLGDNIIKAAGMIKIAKALQNVSALSELYINNNSITEEAADDIAAVVLSNSKLQILNLGDNIIKAAGMIKIAKALQNVSSLSELYINNNSITEEAADDVAAVILNNNKLHVLNLGDNIFKANGISKMAKALQSISCLSELTCTISKSITEEAIDDATDDVAAVILNNNKLQILNIGDKSIGLMKMAKVLRNLSELHITNSNITQEAADDIADVILINSKLQVLHFNGSKLPAAGMIKIAKALQETCFFPY